MRRCAALLLLTGCGLLSPSIEGPDAGDDAGVAADDGGTGGGGSDGGLMPGDGGLNGTITVEPLFSNRSRLGARSAAGFRPWRGGIAVVGTWLYWAESGTAPGLYRAPLTGCDGGACVELVASLTRPSAFAALADSVLVANVNVLRRYATTGTPQTIATGSTELTTLATDGTTAFWTTESAPINRTPFGGVTSVPINSNGTPWVMTVAGARVHWAGVDISGLDVLMQSMRTDGTNARGDATFSGGFQTMRGNNLYLYYSRDFPSQVYRQTLMNARLEMVATNAQGVKDFALDTTHAWWVEPGDPNLASGLLRRVSHESAVAEEIATAIPYPVGLTVHDGVVYVLSAGTQGAAYADGRVLRITIR